MGRHELASQPPDVDGFTLLELLIVILGILASVVVSAVGGITNRGEPSNCAIDERTVSTAVETYLGQHDTSVIPSGGAGSDRYELTLVAEGLIRDVSVNWNIDSTGSLTAQFGSAR